MNAKFETNKTYFCKMSSNTDTLIYITVAKRTAKTIWTKCGNMYRVGNFNGTETIRQGSYSMAPIFFAEDLAA